MAKNEEHFNQMAKELIYGMESDSESEWEIDSSIFDDNYDFLYSMQGPGTPGSTFGHPIGQGLSIEAPLQVPVQVPLQVPLQVPAPAPAPVPAPAPAPIPLIKKREDLLLRVHSNFAQDITYYLIPDEVTNFTYIYSQIGAPGLLTETDYLALFKKIPLIAPTENCNTLYDYIINSMCTSRDQITQEPVTRGELFNKVVFIENLKKICILDDDLYNSWDQPHGDHITVSNLYRSCTDPNYKGSCNDEYLKTINMSSVMLNNKYLYDTMKNFDNYLLTTSKEYYKEESNIFNSQWKTHMFFILNKRVALSKDLFNKYMDESVLNYIKDDIFHYYSLHIPSATFGQLDDLQQYGFFDPDTFFEHSHDNYKDGHLKPYHVELVYFMKEIVKNSKVTTPRMFNSFIYKYIHNNNKDKLKNTLIHSTSCLGFMQNTWLHHIYLNDEQFKNQILKSWVVTYKYLIKLLSVDKYPSEYLKNIDELLKTPLKWVYGDGVNPLKELNIETLPDVPIIRSDDLNVPDITIVKYVDNPDNAEDKIIFSYLDQSLVTCFGQNLTGYGYPYYNGHYYIRDSERIYAFLTVFKENKPITGYFKNNLTNKFNLSETSIPSEYASIWNVCNTRQLSHKGSCKMLFYKFLTLQRYGTDFKWGNYYLSLIVRQDNISAIKCYEKFNFKIVKELDFYRYEQQNNCSNCKVYYHIMYRNPESSDSNLAKISGEIAIKTIDDEDRPELDILYDRKEKQTFEDYELAKISGDDDL